MKHSSITAADQADLRFETFCPVLDGLVVIRDRIGLSEKGIIILKSLLSFLGKPAETPVIFASSAVVAERACGMNERTFRRHISRLEDLGLVRRHRSTNNRRFAVRGPGGAIDCAYGVDVSPLLERAPEIFEMAARVEADAGRARVLRDRLLQLRARLLLSRPDHPALSDLARVLRRKPDPEALAAAIASVEGLESGDVFRGKPAPATSDLSGGTGQDDRHHQRSNEDSIDERTEPRQANVTRAACRAAMEGQERSSPPAPGMENPLPPIARVLDAFPAALSFVAEKPRDWEGLWQCARLMGQWMGITPDLIGLAEHRLGRSGAAVTLLAILEFGDRIRSHGAYLRSLLSGKRAGGFDPWRLLRGAEGRARA